MASTFQWNRHFRKVSVNKTFTHVQDQKKAMSPRHSACIPPSVKSPLGKKTITNDLVKNGKTPKHLYLSQRFYVPLTV